jgi:hypothetical protein
MSDGRLGAARFLVRLYPRAWRARYEDEILALVDETGLSFSELLDLTRGALVEHVRAASGQLVEFLGTTSLERIKGGGPYPLVTAGIALSVALPLHFAATAIASPLARKWPNLSTSKEMIILAPAMFCCVVGLGRLIYLRPRRRPWRADPMFVSRLEAYPLPRINRVVAIASYRLFGVGAVHQWRHSLMLASEGAFWISLAVVARILEEWIKIAEGTAPWWDDFYFSLQVAFFVVAIATAVFRGRRFGVPGASPTA